MLGDLAQPIVKDLEGNQFIEFDWFSMPIPKNLEAGDKVYLDTMYSFAGYYSKQPIGFSMGYASGNYLHSHFIIGEQASVVIGKYVVLEAMSIMANDTVEIRDHCMFSWGSKIVDDWLDDSHTSGDRRKMLEQLAHSKNRYLDIGACEPIVIEENVWVGFDAVVMPGVRLGRGSVVACKTIVTEDVPPYAVVVGNPARIVKYLEPDDTPVIKAAAIKMFS